MLCGNLAPDGAVIKPAAASPHLLQHRGRAVVFDSIEDLHARIDDPDLDVDADSVLVLRGCGPQGYPGMPEVANLPLPTKLLAAGRPRHGADLRRADERHRLRHRRAARRARGGGRRAARPGPHRRLDRRSTSPARRLDVDVPRRGAAAGAPAAAAVDGLRRPTPGLGAALRGDRQQADTGADLDFLVGASGDRGHPRVALREPAMRTGQGQGEVGRVDAGGGHGPVWPQDQRDAGPRRGMSITPLSLPQPPARAPEFGRDALIVCESLVRIYQTGSVEVQALQGLDLAVDSGEMVAVVGASGSGKSTLLSILAGIDAPTAGRARVDRWNLLAMSRADRVHYRRHTVGFVRQQTASNLVPYLTARQMVDLPMTAARTPAATRRDRAAELLDTLGVADCADRRPAQLSGGAADAGRHRRGAGQPAARPAGRRADRRAGHRHVGRGVRGAAGRQPAASASPSWW